MKYYVTTNKQKTDAEGAMPVAILFKDGNRRFSVFTGMKTMFGLENSSFDKKEPNGMVKKRRLNKILTDIDTYLLEWTGRKSYDEMKPELSAIVSGKEKKATKVFADYVDEYREKKTHGSTSQLYAYTSAKVREYDAKATFDTVTVDWLEGFERHFMKTMQVNGLAIQMRNIRTVFNWALDNEWTEKYPFRRYKIKQEKTVINNISVEDLRMLREYRVENWQEIYRDFFMLSFYLCGINPGDLLMLKPSDMKNGRISYKRMKTGRVYNIPVIEEAAEIIEKYKGEKYLLNPMDNLSDYHIFNQHWNKALKKIGPSEIVPDKVGKMRKIEYHPILPNITVYTARYTFASIGAELDIPRETIALCLGHAWTDVTSHYIAYDMKKIDGAVRKIVDYLNGKK